ncbi:MAG: hypothetical protein ACI89L_001884 [Phycisphaerales bacterium]|jgi:hypothetical protein
MRQVTGRLVFGMVVLGCAMGLGRGASPQTVRDPGDSLRAVKSSSYQIETDVDQATIDEIGRHMDRIFREYTKRFSDYPVRNATALKLWVFERQADYGEYLAGMGVNAAGSGGMFFVSGKGAGLATFLEGRPLEVVLETLRHEGLHQFAYLRVHESLPQWVNEGLGEYFGYSVETRAGIEPGVVDESALSRLHEAIEKDDVFTLGDLLFMTNGEWNARVNSGDARAVVMYDQSWSVVHFLMHAERGKYERLLWDFLRASWQGLSPEQASEKIFTRDLDAMDKAWREYVAGLKPDPIVEAKSRLGIFERALRELHEADQHPKDLDELARVLRERGFAGTYARGETERPIDGDPDGPGGWWMAFPESLRGRAAVIRFTPDRRKARPPNVEIRGLRQPVRLIWKLERDGTLISDILVG